MLSKASSGTTSRRFQRLIERFKCLFDECVNFAQQKNLNSIDGGKQGKILLDPRAVMGRRTDTKQLKIVTKHINLQFRNAETVQLYMQCDSADLGIRFL